MTIKIETIILFIIMMPTSIYFFYKQYKKYEDPFSRGAGIIALIVYIITWVLFYFDIYNIPSTLGYTRNININNWFNFLGQLFASIIGGIILIWITLFQIDEQKKNDKEDKRINNAPIFKYTIQNEKVNMIDKVYQCSINGNLYILYVNIENIGLNHAKNTRVVILDENEKEMGNFKLDGQQSFLKKEENRWLKFGLFYNYDKDNIENNKKTITLNIFYEDLLQNKYRQQIDLSIYLKAKLYYFHINNIEIHDEELINKDKR